MTVCERETNTLAEKKSGLRNGNGAKLPAAVFFFHASVLICVNVCVQLGRCCRPGVCKRLPLRPMRLCIV